MKRNSIGYGRVVTHDLYDIADRLKEIDEDYFVFYSYRDKRYEVHHKGQRGDTFALAVPYDELDVRSLRLVRRTRPERAEKLIEEMEKQNREAEKRARDRAVENAALNTERIFSSFV